MNNKKERVGVVGEECTFIVHDEYAPMPKFKSRRACACVRAAYHHNLGLASVCIRYTGHDSNIGVRASVRACILSYK